MLGISNSPGRLPGAAFAAAPFRSDNPAGVLRDEAWTNVSIAHFAVSQSTQVR
jgi:hypothetical protein